MLPKELWLYGLQSQSINCTSTFKVILQRNVHVKAVRPVCESQSEVRVLHLDDKVPGAVADGLDRRPGVRLNRTLGVQFAGHFVKEPDVAFPFLDTRGMSAKLSLLISRGLLQRPMAHPTQTVVS